MLNSGCQEPVQTFQAFTYDLHRMADWLVSHGIKTVAMESTGVYWVPVYEILEERGLEVVLSNARDTRSVPGRKTDVNDAQWIQRLHACGLLKASFRPESLIVELRSYLRVRERLLDYAAAHIQHMQKALTFMNIQLNLVVADITGVTGMRMIRAIADGERCPAKLAEFRDNRCKSSQATIEAALVGNYQPEHVFALRQSIAMYDAYQVRVGECDVEIEKVLNRLLSKSRQPEALLPKPKHRTRQPNCIKFDVRPSLYQIVGLRSHPDSWHRPVSGPSACLGVWHGYEPVADCQTFHVLANTLSRLQNQWWQGVVCPLEEKQ
jgi:transposase